MAQTTQTPNPSILQLQNKFKKLEDFLNQKIIGHPDMVRGAILSLLASEHLLFIGPPGTAKTLLANTLSDAIYGAKSYRYLLTKYTEFAELFGALDINALSQGQYKRNWSGIIYSHIVFLDEIFKANSAILNSLLSLLNERVVYDPLTGQSIEASLLMAIGASNELPVEEELQALFDRFLVKVYVGYLDDQLKITQALESVWGRNTVNEKILTIQEVQQAQEIVKGMLSQSINLRTTKVPLFQIYGDSVFAFIKSLRSKGVIISDRTIISKLPKLFAAYLFLNMDNGKITVTALQNWVFDIMPLLARSTDEKKLIEKSLDEALGEVAELQKKLNEGIELMKAMNLKDASEKFREILNFDINKIPDYLMPRAEVIIKQAKQYLDKINQIQQTLTAVEDGET
ncbi:MAG: AAA family ATPase [Sulfolobaceae archaeon]